MAIWRLGWRSVGGGVASLHICMFFLGYDVFLKGLVLRRLGGCKSRWGVLCLAGLGVSGTEELQNPLSRSLGLTDIRFCTK